MSKQDGKPDLAVPNDTSSTLTRAVSDSGRGTIIFTLCLPASSAQGADRTQFRHAVVPFPETYDDACKDALRIFFPFLPLDTEAVSLRVARELSGGKKVWCIVSDKDWAQVVNRKGDECGVFPPDIAPDTVPYTVAEDLPKVFITIIGPYRYDNRGRRTSDRVIWTLAAASMADIMNAAKSMRQRGNFPAPKIKYDMRMVGQPEMVEAYLQSRSGIVVGNACLGEVKDMDTVRYLAGLFSGPLTIYVTDE